MKISSLCIVIFLIALMTACGNRRTSPEVLQRKIDSIYAEETLRQLKLRGVDLEDKSPFHIYYDSLAIQSLPLSYSEDYVKSLPNFTIVPQSIVTFLELEGGDTPKAIALPESMGLRLVLLAADVTEDEYELWLYSLDNECYPVDKLLLYAPKVISDANLQVSEQETYFSITSDYEIRVLEYASDDDRFGQLSTFVVDDSLMFVEKTPF